MLEKKPLELSSQVFAIIVFAIVAALALAIAKHKGFFCYYYVEKKKKVDLKTLFYVFAIYILISVIISPIFLGFLKTAFEKKAQMVTLNTITLLSIINIFNDLLIFSAFGLFFAFFAKDLFRSIWKEGFSSYFDDIKIGLFSFFIAFPTVLFLSNLLELLLVQLFNIHHMPNQVAIEYVKSVYGHPLHFSIAIFSIVISAPLIEELLFRGILQNYLKKYFTVTHAIFISSLIFSFFHFSTSQKYSNIIILISLFVLSLFLGFVYERQQSLISPIILHATFNGISVINLLILKEPF